MSEDTTQLLGNIIPITEYKKVSTKVQNQDFTEFYQQLAAKVGLTDKEIENRKLKNAQRSDYGENAFIDMMRAIEENTGNKKFYNDSQFVSAEIRRAINKIAQKSQKGKLSFSLKLLKQSGFSQDIKNIVRKFVKFYNTTKAIKNFNYQSIQQDYINKRRKDRLNYKTSAKGQFNDIYAQYRKYNATNIDELIQRKNAAIAAGIQKMTQKLNQAVADSNLRIEGIARLNRRNEQIDIEPPRQNNNNINLDEYEEEEKRKPSGLQKPINKASEKQSQGRTFNAQNPGVTTRSQQKK